MSPSQRSVENLDAPDQVLGVEETTCCIVGGGPAGMILALLLARRGVPVTVLEAHADFDREFRGDTLHPGTLEILDQIGLTRPLHEIPHVKWSGVSVVSRHGRLPLIDFARLKTRFPYIMLVPQERFLELLAGEAAKYPHFRLVMRARVQQLVTEAGIVRGVRYRAGSDQGWHEVRAPLTVGADGRFSRLRHLAEMKPVEIGKPMELLWFRVPRLASDARELDTIESLATRAPFAVLHGEAGAPVGFVYRGDGFVLLVTNRVDHWQIAYIYPPGSYHALKAAGLESFRRSVAALEPGLAQHLDAVSDWRQLAPLSVGFSRCRRWYKPGLLLIGDAAHVMTPAAGAGIKYAIEDAVEAANVLVAPLQAGHVEIRHLAQVQRRRECATRLIQTAAAFQQRTAMASAFQAGDNAEPPAALLLLARLMASVPGVGALPARFVAFGFRRVRIQEVAHTATN